MAEKLSYLSASEQELLARHDESKLVDTIYTVGVLASRLVSMSEVAGQIRESDPMLAKKIGNKARQVLALLEQLGVVPVISVEMTFVEGTEEIEEPILVQMAELTVELEIKPLANEGVTPKGMKWLVKHLSIDWHLRLGIDQDASAETIADALIQADTTRRHGPLSRYKTRLIGKLEGKSDVDTATLTSGDNKMAVYMYARSLFTRVNQDGTHEPVAQSMFKESTIVGESASITRLPKPAVVEYPDVHKLKQTMDNEPVLEELSDMISVVVGLTGPHRVALRSFLDPKTKTDMTSFKEDAVRQVREVIREKIDDPLYGLTQPQKQWLRRSFGVYSFNGSPQDQKPIPLNELSFLKNSLNRTTDIPRHIHFALDKLFTQQPDAVRCITELTQGAIALESMPEEIFEHERNLLFQNLSESGILTTVQAEALRRRSQFGEKNQHMESSSHLKEALRVILSQVVASGGVNSGSQLIDAELIKFIGPVLMSSHLDALRSELPLELQEDRRYIERIITAGISSVYEQIMEVA
jgi:hypothetical protein